MSAHEAHAYFKKPSLSRKTAQLPRSLKMDLRHREPQSEDGCRLSDPSLPRSQ